MQATDDVREVADLVPMALLLAALGFDVNERMRRCACLIHGGKNPSAFAWRNDGLWKCHSCGAGGDRITLVRTMRKCSFREALEFFAVLTGRELRSNLMNHTEIKQLQSEQTSFWNDASLALAVCDSSWQAARNTVLQLEAIQRKAGRRLREIGAGSPERWRGETEWCWTALAEVSCQMPRAAAAYTIASFGKFRDRLRFALDPAVAEQLLGEALENGCVTDERGRRIEVIL